MQRARRHPIRRSALALAIASVAAAAAAACRSAGEVPEAGALLLRVHAAAGAPAPDELRVSVYDDTGVLFRDARVPTDGALPPPGAAGLLGTVLVQPGAARGPLRMLVRALRGGAAVEDAVLTVAPDVRAQPAHATRATIDVALATELQPDGDGDGVPDAIDDCPAVPNSDQGACATDEPPVEDAGAGGADAGAADADPPPVDATPPLPDAPPGDAPPALAQPGDPCTAAAACASGFCADGVCCATACTGACRSCNQPGAEGTCAGYADGTDPERECMGGATCNGAGACGPIPGGGKPTGDLCGAAGECASGFCKDGVCCNSACDQACESCATGACQQVKSGSDAPECAAPMTCNARGKCTGG